MAITKSPIPILGLAHRADVIRKADADDGAGGVIPGGSETTIYSSRKCRITNMDGEDQQKLFGNSSEHRWLVLFEFSPNIAKSDFVRVAWGTFPNLASGAGQGDQHPPQAVVSTPGGNQTLNWSEANGWYEDSTGDYTLEFAGGVWTFTDAVAVDSVDLPSYVIESHNPFLPDWSALNANYSVVSTGGPNLEYRILWRKDQIDDQGRWHHTSVVMELED